MFVVRIEVPGQKPVIETDHVSVRSLLTRNTRFGPMRFVNTGEVVDGAVVFRVPGYTEPVNNLESFWNGGELLPEREEETNPVYLSGGENTEELLKLGRIFGSQQRGAA